MFFTIECLDFTAACEIEIKDKEIKNLASIINDSFKK